MTVSSNWEKQLTELRKYIEEQPEIRITENSVFIPKSVRSNFNQLFDTVRQSVVEELLPTLPVAAQALIDSYNEEERNTIDTFSLKDVSLSAAAQDFFHNPVHGLMRALYDSLFAVLQDKIDAKAFKQESVSLLDNKLKEYFRYGYEAWMMLGIINIISPDKLFDLQIGDISKGYSINNITYTQLEVLPISHKPIHPSIKLPDFIMHSIKLDNYIAITLEERINTKKYVGVPEYAQGILKAGGANMGSHYICLYSLKSLSTPPVLADMSEGGAKNPDLLIEIFDNDEIHKPLTFKELGIREDILKPKFKAYSIYDYSMQAIDFEPPQSEIQLTNIGLDLCKLRTIMAPILKVCDEKTSSESNKCGECHNEIRHE